MQRIHLLGSSEVDALAGSTVHAVLPAFALDPKYKSFFKLRSEKGEEVVYINGNSRISAAQLTKHFPELGARTIFIFMKKEADKAMAVDDSRKLKHAGYKAVVVVRPEYIVDDYNFISSETDNDVCIGIPCLPSEISNGFGRFNKIRELIFSHKWNLRRKHYLWELENPAELAAYAKAFIFRIQSTFAGFVSKRCYEDSLLGITYSPSKGLLYTGFLGNELLKHPYTCKQQYSLFMLNDETVKGFVTGKLGADIWNLLNAKEGLNDDN